MSEKKHHHKKDEITIIDNGPVYICEFCNALLRVPDSCLREDEIQEEDDDGPYKVTLWTFDCPKCGEENIADEDDGAGSDSEDEPKLEKKDKKEKSEKSEKSEKKEKKERK